MRIVFGFGALPLKGGLQNLKVLMRGTGGFRNVITTMHSKMEYDMQKDGQGRTTIKKVGLAPVQRAGIEYEFTFVIDMDTDHNAIVSKSRAADLADLVKNKPDTQWFAKFYTWLVEGEKPPRTKEELIQYGAGFELSPQEIAAALKESNIQFAGDEETWAMMTNVLAEYAENKNGQEAEMPIA